jgi:hypothetical protein
VSNTPESQIVVVRERLTPVRVVTVRKLLAENLKLRKDIESMGRELATMRAANVELQERLSAVGAIGDDGK